MLIIKQSEQTNMSFSSLVPFTLPFLILSPVFLLRVLYMIIFLLQVHYMKMEAEILMNQLVIELKLIVEEPHKQSFLFQFTKNRLRTFFPLTFPTLQSCSFLSSLFHWLCFYITGTFSFIFF